MRILKWTALSAVILYLGAYLGIRFYSYKVPHLYEDGLESIYYGSSESDVDAFFSMTKTESEEFTPRDVSLPRIFSVLVWLDKKLTGAEFIDLNSP